MEGKLQSFTVGTKIFAQICRILDTRFYAQLKYEKKTWAFNTYGSKNIERSLKFRSDEQ